MAACLAAVATWDEVIKRQVLRPSPAQITGVVPVVEDLPPESAFAFLARDQFGTLNGMVHAALRLP